MISIENKYVYLLAILFGTIIVSSGAHFLIGMDIEWAMAYSLILMCWYCLNDAIENINFEMDIVSNEEEIDSEDEKVENEHED